MSAPQEPGKSIPPAEYSLKYISWHQKDIVSQLKILNEQMTNLCNILREFTGARAPEAKKPSFSNDPKRQSFSNDQDLPF